MTGGGSRLRRCTRADAEVAQLVPSVRTPARRALCVEGSRFVAIGHSSGSMSEVSIEVHRESSRNRRSHRCAGSRCAHRGAHRGRSGAWLVCSGREGGAMTDVIVVGSGPTGMMLAGELALAGVDVSIVERRETPELAGRARAASTRARSRSSISAGSPTDSSQRGRSLRRRGSARRCSTSATFRRGIRMASACGRTAWSRSLRAGSRSSASRSVAGTR